MKQTFLILLFSIFASICFGQSCKKMYKNKLEANSKLISCGGNYTIEKLSNGSCILKRYYPDNKTITQLITSKTDKFKVKHGLFQERWDDGTLVTSGMYSHNLKDGEWRENIHEIGIYVDGKKEGSWKTYKDSLVTNESNYSNGVLHGKELVYDSLGQIKLEQEFNQGALISSTMDTTIKKSEEMPRFPGCENLNLSKEDLDECAKKKLLEYIYGSLKYPKKARERDIQGKALLQYVVDTNGDIVDIYVLNGVSKEIEKETIKLIQNMPTWIPGKQDGKAVKVLYTLPVVFALQ